LKTEHVKTISEAEALEKLKHFCAYQERSRKQVVQKMKLLGHEEEWTERLLSLLEQENYLNEARFKASYIKGKSKIKGWGPKKIEQHLGFELGEKINVSQLLQKEDFEQAKLKMKRDMEKKYRTLSSKNDTQSYPKLLRFCLSRGFSMEDAQALAKDIIA